MTVPPELAKKIDAEIVRLRDTFNMSFGDVAVEVNTRFETALTRSAVGARYNRANGKPNPHMSQGKREARKQALPYVRPANYAANAPVDPVKVAAAQQQAEYYRLVGRGQLFTLMDGMRYKTLLELREDMCRWPLIAQATTFYCGEPVNDHHVYCNFHRQKARQ